MGDWHKKLDSITRMELEDGGELSHAIGITIELSEPLQGSQQQELEATGLKLWSLGGTVLSGQVADRATLQRLAELEFVRRVRAARPLFPEQDHSAANTQQEDGNHAQD